MKLSCRFKFSIFVAIIASLGVLSLNCPAAQLSGTNGMLQNDTNPTGTAITSWGGWGGAYFDYSNRSFAVNFGAPQVVRSIALRDKDDTTRMITNTNYRLFRSADNSTYTEFTNFTLGTNVVNGRMIHTLRFNVTSQYIKVKSAFTDNNQTFVLDNLQEDMRASSTVAGMKSGDTDPASGVITWGSAGSIALDYGSRSVALDFGVTQAVRSVKLRDSDSSSRLVSTNYTLWYSTNNTEYTKIPTNQYHFYSEVMDGRRVDAFTGFDVTARYIKVHSDISATTGYNFILKGLQEDIWSLSNKVPDFGVAMQSDGDRLFPTNTDWTVAQVTNQIIYEVNNLSKAGIKTLRMGCGTDVMNWNCANGTGSPRHWRLLSGPWQMTYNQWTNYLSLYRMACTASNLFAAGVEPILVAGTAAKNTNMYYFLTYRIADSHFMSDPTNYPLTSRFYLEHEASADPDDRVAIKHSGVSPVPGRGSYSNLMNFGNFDVWTNRYSDICEALDRYTNVMDGLTIEFNRNLALFPLNEGIDSTNVVTDFLQALRGEMDIKEAALKRSLYLGIHVPGDQFVAVSNGLDTAEQIRARRVDYVISSTIMTVPHDLDMRNWVAAGLPNDPCDNGVAIYAGLPANKPKGWAFPLLYTDPAKYGTASDGADHPQVIGAARGFYAMGVEGIELYNFAGLAATASKTTYLSNLVNNLKRYSQTLGQTNRIFAISPVWTEMYEGRLEKVKQLPAEFRADGHVWANSTDGDLIDAGTIYTGAVFFTECNSGDTCLLRLGLRDTNAPPYVISNVTLRVNLNGHDLVNLQLSGLAGFVNVGAAEISLPTPTHYLTLEVSTGNGHLQYLRTNEFNNIVVEQTGAAKYKFGLQEVQIGVFP
jgi:hypothetical protein